MRNWRNWLLPILTCLILLCLAVLPLRLSAVRDGKLTGAVHAEELGEGGSFPVRPPELAKRLELLAKWQETPGDLAIVGQELEESSEELELVGAAAREELERLEALGVIPEGVVDYTEVSAARVYLRDPQDLSSTGFWRVWNHNGVHLTMILDSVTWNTLYVRLYLPAVKKVAEDPETVGMAFLDRLGVAYETGGGLEGAVASFRVTDSGVCCRVELKRDWLEITPRLDWENPGTGSASAYDG